MKFLTGAVVGAVLAVIGWLIFAFVFMMPGNTGWSGIEPFMLAPFMMIFGGLISTLLGVAIKSQPPKQ